MLRRLAAAAVLPLLFVVTGCSQAVIGTGQPAAGAPPGSPAALAAAGSSTAEPTEAVPPANVDKGQTWLYADGLELGIVGIVPYDGANATIRPGEYAVRFTFEVTNAGSTSVNLASWDFEGECEGGAELADALDDSLAPPGKLAAGRTATYESGVAIQDSGKGHRCTMELTPGSAYEPAWFAFTAPNG